MPSAWRARGSWLVAAVRRDERLTLSSHFVSDAVGLAAFGLAFYISRGGFDSLATGDEWAEFGSDRRGWGCLVYG